MITSTTHTPDLAPLSAAAPALPKLTPRGFRRVSDGEYLHDTFFMAEVSPSIATTLVSLEDAHAAILADRARDTGPRPAPPDGSIAWDVERLEKAAKAGRAAYGLCPAGCGCIWRDNLDGSMSLGVSQRSCTTCEYLPFSKLIPLFSPAEGTPPQWFEFGLRCARAVDEANRQRDLAREALAELVACKALKEQIPLAATVRRSSELSAEYERRQPIAWAAARHALASILATEGAAS